MIKVFIIDDSLMVRNGILTILKGAKEIQIIGEAPNPVDAIALFKKVGFPDVFILDIEMPKMDGLTFLKKINEQNPTPVIICSTLVSLGSSAAIDALRLGAVEIVEKPMVGVKSFFQEQQDYFINAIKSAARSKLLSTKTTLNNIPIKTHIQNLTHNPSDSFIAIGSSTGGVQVLEEIFTNLQKNHKGIVVTQHMPQGFTASFAKRLDGIVASKVVEASDGLTICDNQIIIAKGGIHTEVYFEDGNYKVKLRDFPRVNSHKPSVNVLFKSISKCINNDVIAFILTGMGNDGATGIKALKDLGYNTYGQNENSCTVYGMSKSAKDIDGLTQELDIRQIIDTINNYSVK